MENVAQMVKTMTMKLSLPGTHMVLIHILYILTMF
jgi:hypothetical protein